VRGRAPRGTCGLLALATLGLGLACSAADPCVGTELIVGLDAEGALAADLTTVEATGFIKYAVSPMGSCSRMSIASPCRKPDARASSCAVTPISRLLRPTAAMSARQPCAMWLLTSVVGSDGLYEYGWRKRARPRGRSLARQARQSFPCFAART
jgi:hypothetical protein